jgi:CRISPR-associated exonuclease Cas4
MPEFKDEDLIMVSGLEHYEYCPRQYALIHIEKIFEENIYTMKGHIAHERVHSGETRNERGVRVERALPLWSRKLGLTGVSDVVEFRGETPFPIEYKSGRPHRNNLPADVQLCAQAMCLEEMLNVIVPEGAVFHVNPHRRRDVEFTFELRQRVIQVVEAIRAIHSSSVMPQPADDERCTDCSLNKACVPKIRKQGAKNSMTVKSIFKPLPLD